ncbi:hypothetical protein Cgig2_032471 [Carnegiea gigantea]|uniref:Uncharacterized protein n=1 Tax=Carnegiea gigantea TaxID=171969 RepID=A0A9Q1KXY9_9CARY|nr:hypothetical protein Cgig2_032471 [Carnegiea gigantea]
MGAAMLETWMDEFTKLREKVASFANAQMVANASTHHQHQHQHQLVNNQKMKDAQFGNSRKQIKGKKDEEDGSKSRQFKTTRRKKDEAKTKSNIYEDDKKTKTLVPPLEFTFYSESLSITRKSMLSFYMKTNMKQQNYEQTVLHYLKGQGDHWTAFSSMFHQDPPKNESFQHIGHQLPANIRLKPLRHRPDHRLNRLTTIL